jgi:hypothetical protein
VRIAGQASDWRDWLYWRYRRRPAQERKSETRLHVHYMTSPSSPSATASVAKHCTEITLTPEGRTYQISGDWNLLGGRSDGAGGQNRTGYARLFRAALYQ